MSEAASCVEGPATVSKMPLDRVIPRLNVEQEARVPQTVRRRTASDKCPISRY